MTLVKRLRAIEVMILMALACKRSARQAADSAQATGSSSTCYVAAESMLGRDAATPPGFTSTQPAIPDSLRGWLRLDRTAESDSGAAWLTDSDQSAMPGAWRRAGDSLLILAFNDFLRIELHVAVTPTQLRGRGLATSDAAQDRASDGRLLNYRRNWVLQAEASDCAAMPLPPAPGPPAT